jgi:hypothetical protein
MALRLGIFVPWLGALLIAGGCATVEPGTSHKPLLAQSTPPPDAVSLEIFLASASGGKHSLDELWKEIDEQSFSPELRRQLAQNGMRAGLVGSQVPAELARLLKLSDKPVPKDEPANVTAEQSTVSLRVLQLRAGHPAEIQPLEHVYDELPLLMLEDGQLRGRTYYKAEGRFTLRAFPEPDGKVRVELTPELEHGEQHQRWVGDDGIMRLDASRSKRVFDQLAVAAHLAPGEILVMTSLPDRAGSVGHYFFNEGAASEQPVQKLMVIRATQAGTDPRFKAEPPPKSLDLNVQ